MPQDDIKYEPSDQAPSDSVTREPCRRCLGLVGKSVAHNLDCPNRKPGRRPRQALPPLPDLTPSTDLDTSNVRAVIFEAFNQLGGMAGLVYWGRQNPEKFYQLWAKLGPRSAGRSPGTDRAVTVDIPGFEDDDGAA